MGNKDVTTYSTAYKYMHWGIALLVITMLSFGFFLGGLPGSFKPAAYMLHKSTGLTILALMLIRLVWIIKSGKPALPSYVPFWERLLATTVQRLLYIGLIGMALAGWIMATASNKIPVYFGLFRVPCPFIPQNEELAHWMNSTHKNLAWVLLVLVGLHIAGALKHWLIQKDDVIDRMLP